MVSLVKKGNWASLDTWSRSEAMVTSVIGWPSSKILPRCGSRNRRSRLYTVDFPDPMPPTRATVSPSSMENEIPSSTICPAV